MKQCWIPLQLRFEAQNLLRWKAVTSGGLQWQDISIIATFSSELCCI